MKRKKKMKERRKKKMNKRTKIKGADKGGFWKKFWSNEGKIEEREED